LKVRQQPTNFLFDREWGFLFEKKIKKKFKKKFKKTNLIRKNLRKKFKIIKRGHIGKRGILSSRIGWPDSRQNICSNTIPFRSSIPDYK
jgi:hypothetical protein